MLHALRWGEGPPLVLLHGFTQSSGSWGPLAEALGSSHAVTALDAPGHGRSAGVAAGLWEGADLMVATAGRGAWLGYSMGGRYALHVALRHPEAVTSLVLVSATAGIEEESARARRRAEDLAMAAKVEQMGLEAFLAWWLSRPMFSSLPKEAAALESRLSGSAAGLASSLRLAGTGAQEPLWDRLGSISAPTLVVAGEADLPYLELARRMARLIGPNATLAVVPGAGHACHLEQPDAFLAAVLPFLRSSTSG